MQQTEQLTFLQSEVLNNAKFFWIRYGSEAKKRIGQFFTFPAYIDLQIATTAHSYQFDSTLFLAKIPFDSRLYSPAEGEISEGESCIVLFPPLLPVEGKAQSVIKGMVQPVFPTSTR